MTATPRLDAVRAWLDGDPATPIAWPEERPDPDAWADPDQRQSATVAMAASGAPAQPLRRAAVIDGKPIPPPPSRRGRAPKPRGEHRPPRKEAL